MTLHERGLFAFAGVLLAAALGLDVYGCGLFAGSPAAPAPSPETISCVVRYQGCAAALTDASTMADYLACRGGVDRDCLTDAGGQ